MKKRRSTRAAAERPNSPKGRGEVSAGLGSGHDPGVSPTRGSAPAPVDFRARVHRTVARHFLRWLSEHGYYVFRNQETTQKDPTALSHDELAEKFGRSVGG